MLNHYRKEKAMEQTQNQTGKRSARQVFTIAQRNGKSYWIKIGASFQNQDGSETVLLDALPVNGRMQIREMKGEREAKRTGG
jgi:hypothetical protein